MRTNLTSRKTLIATLIALTFTAAASMAQTLVKLDARLYQTTTNQMLDAAVVVFDAQYSNAIDGNDAVKFSNSGENLGIRRNTTTLVVEARQPATANDEVPLWIWGLQQTQQYTIEIVASNMANTASTAVLKDNFLNTTTPLNLTGTTRVNFTINSTAASYAQGRFKVMFVQAGPLPVRFTGITAAEKSNGIKVEWKVADELNIDHYEVERSFNGRDFTVAGTVAATGNAGMLTYSFTDPAPASFYRVRSIGRAGDRQYSSIVKLALVQICSYGVAPNPSTDGNFNVNINSVAGKLTIRAIDKEGRIIKTSTINHAGGTAMIRFELPSSAPSGIYRLLVTAPDNSNSNMSLMVIR